MWLIFTSFFSFFKKKDFVSSFRSEGGLAGKLAEKEINQWKGTGLSGSESGKAYNNGWINPKQPRILNGRVIIFDNYSQTKRNINPVKISRFELDIFYRLLSDISQNNNLDLDYIDRINKLGYSKLPLWGQRVNLLNVWNEHKYDLILQSIKEARSVEEVNKQTSNIEALENSYLPSQKRKINLIKAQNDQLNSFLNETQRKVLGLAIQGKSIFYTGSAGTGKSFLLQRIIRSLELLKRKIAVTAPTGIAAVNIGGTTIHSFSGIGIFGDTLSSEELVKKILKQNKQTWVNNWVTIDTLIIDEISMISGVIFDKLEYIAQKVRKSYLPFGGLQLILTGDFFQLPPVNSSKLAFEAKKWNYVLSHAINLTKIYRQTEPKLINLLNEIRFGEISNESREVLKELEKEPNLPDDGIKATRLVGTNDEKDVINDAELNKIDGKIHNFRAIDWEDERYKGRLELLKNSCPAVDNLELKRGCQVMLIKNLRDSAEELVLVNGSRGIVMGFDEKNYPIVRFTNGIKWVIKVEEWTDETPLHRLVRARRIQIPLILSWAITIHKSQGQSIERLKVDLSRVFERGQTYVALSRACSIKYLQVIGFNSNKVYCDEKVKKFYQELSMI